MDDRRARQRDGETDFPAHVVQALAQRVDVTVPPDFARRTAALAVGQRPPRHRWRVRWALQEAGWGPRLASAGCLVLAVVLFALAPHTTPSFGDLRFDLELLLLPELGALAYVAVRFGLSE